MRFAWWAVVAAFAFLAAATLVFPHPQYTPDGMVYARYAARDTGTSERNATLAVRAFYERTPLAASHRYRPYVEIDPAVAFARSRIFSNRILYSAVSAALLGPLGFRALFAVSALSYVAFGLLLFWMLASMSRAWIAAVATVAALLLPLTRLAASSDLSDMLAMVWWTLALGALLRGLRDGRMRWPAVLGAASVLLALTRPTPYLIVLPAAAAAWTTQSLRLLVASLAGVAAFALAASATHAFGIREQLRWVYLHARGANARETENGWYERALSDTALFFAAQSIRGVFPAAGLAAWVYALRVRAARPEAAVIGAAALACVLSIFFNPVPSAVDRVVMLPLVPVCCSAIALALECGADELHAGAAHRERGAKASAENCAPL